MSRCFPYPPPGYQNIRSRGGEGLTESTKLQKDKNKTVTERRKEKKRQRDQSGLPKEQRDARDGKTKRIRFEKSLHCEKTAGLLNLSDDSPRSGLSEEHDQAIPESQFCHTNATDSSNNQKLDASSPSTAQSAGNKIRIRFTFKQKPLEKEPVCSTSTSRDVDPLIQPVCRVVNTQVQDQPSSSASIQKEPLPSPTLKFNTGRTDAPTESKVEKKPSIESIYKALIVDWAPPTLTDIDDPDDQDWLFSSKKQNKKASERLKPEANGNTPCRQDGVLFPRAHFLPEVDIFALPYTIPF